MGASVLRCVDSLGSGMGGSQAAGGPWAAGRDATGRYWFIVSVKIPLVVTPSTLAKSMSVVPR
jgi:hypothetical protein